MTGEKINGINSALPQAEPAVDPSKHLRIPGIDGLRAFACLLVLIQHANGTFPFPSETAWWLVSWFANGILGVSIFFVISGFLITHLLRKEWESTGRIHLGAFYVRRSLRIFPVFYSFIAVLVVLRTQGLIHTRWEHLLISGIYLTNYRQCFTGADDDGYAILGHTWTLSLEEQFYLFWPAILVWFGIKRAPRVASAIVLLSPLLRVLTYQAWPGARGQLLAMVHTAADTIMFGCLIALWRGQPWFDRLTSRVAHVFFPLLALTFLLFVSPPLGHRFGGYYTVVSGCTLNALAISVILLWILRFPQSWTVRKLESPLVRYIGVRSYSLYLWQSLILSDQNHTWVNSFPYNLICCFVVADLSYRLIEMPFLNLRKRFRFT